MKASTLAILAASVALISDTESELRERCAEPTRQKFAALKTDLESEIKAGVNEPEPVASQGTTWTPEQIETLTDTIGDRLSLEIHAALNPQT